MHQKVRYDTLDAFKEDDIRLLVCSDVAARGLDVAGMSHVFNYDVPFNAEDYVHRIGRTGRAGMKGRAFTLVTRDDDKPLKAIEKLLDQKIPEFEGDQNKETGQSDGSGQKKQQKDSLLTIDQ